MSINVSVMRIQVFATNRRCITCKKVNLEPRLVHFSHFCELNWIGCIGDQVSYSLDNGYLTRMVIVLKRLDISEC